MNKHRHHQNSPQCAELLSQISDFVDGELEARLCAELESHLANCKDCQVLVDTTKKTISLYRRQHRQNNATLPADISARLWQALSDAGCSAPADST